jgi:hypothetical protein
MNPGLRVLLPGLAQLGWKQRDRGVVFLVSFVASLATSGFCWGETLGWAFLGFAFLTQAAAAFDVLHQCAFPIFHARTALAATILGMGLALYLPVAAFLWFYAFPARSGAATGVGYLVDCLAYQAKAPRPGEWIWLRPSARLAERAGQVVAVSGQEVEWTGRRWRVDGKDLDFAHPGTLPYYPDGWKFRVPENHVLIGPDTFGATSRPVSPLVIVGRNQIVGRAWARYYPFWDRCLL